MIAAARNLQEQQGIWMKNVSFGFMAWLHGFIVNNFN